MIIEFAHIMRTVECMSDVAAIAKRAVKIAKECDPPYLPSNFFTTMYDLSSALDVLEGRFRGENAKHESEASSAPGEEEEL